MKRFLPIVALVVGAVTLQAQGARPSLIVTVHVRPRPQAISPEGFVEQADKELNDSVADVAKALAGKVFHPKKGYPGSTALYRVVPTPDDADLVLTIAARGFNTEAYGSRTSMSIYRGVVTADTVPTVGVTRWVSIILSVGTYQKELTAWASNRSTRYSGGAWGMDASSLALQAAAWVMANEPQIRARQKPSAAGGTGEPAHRTCANSAGQVIACP